MDCSTEDEDSKNAGHGGQHSKNPSKLTQNTPRAGKQTAANIEAKCKFAIPLWEFKEISAPHVPQTSRNKEKALPNNTLGTPDEQHKMHNGKKQD